MASEIKKVGKYVLGDTLGEGATSKVKEAIDSTNLRRVAVKIINRTMLRKIKNGEANLQREIKCLKLVQHPNVIRLVEVMEKETKIYMVMEYASHGSLQQLQESSPEGKFPLEWARSFFYQIVEGLEACHSKGVVHRDIKPGNVLVNMEGIAKISDFGVAELLGQWEGDKSSTWSGSPAFQSPELCGGDEVEFSGVLVDVWAAGVTLYIMAFGEAPFHGNTMCDLFENICKGKFSVPEGTDADLSDLLHRMLEVEAQQRIDIPSIKRHPWLRLPPITPKLPPLAKGSSSLMERLLDSDSSEEDQSPRVSASGSGAQSPIVKVVSPLRGAGRTPLCQDDEDEDDLANQKLPGEVDFNRADKKCSLQ